MSGLMSQGLHTLMFAVCLGVMWWGIQARVSTLRLICASLVLSTLLVVPLFRVSEPGGSAIWWDFINAYWHGGNAVLHGPEALWVEVGKGVLGFVNLPILAYLFAPFGALDTLSGAKVFAWVGIPFLFASWFLTCRVVNATPKMAALLLVLFAANGPLINSYKIANTSHIVLAMMAGTLLLLRSRRDLLAGVVLGMVALIKLPLLLFGVYFLARRRWRVVTGGAIVVVSGAAASLLLFGLPLHEHWYMQTVEPFAREPIAAYNAQSVHAFMARLEAGWEGLRSWHLQPIPDLARWAATGMQLLLLGLAAFVCYRASRKAPSAPAPSSPAGRPEAVSAADVELEFLLVLTLACVISPLSWSHYYCWLLLPASYLLAQPEKFLKGRAERIAGVASLLLMSLPIVYVDIEREWLRSVYAFLPASYLLVSGMLMLGILLWVRHRESVPAGQPALPLGSTARLRRPTGLAGVPTGTAREAAPAQSLRRQSVM